MSWASAPCGLFITACGLFITACGWAITACGWAITACGWAITACGLFITACGSAAAPAPVHPKPPDEVTLTLLGTNDVHGHVESLPWLGGYAEVLRKQGRPLLLLDAGDMFQGTLASNMSEGASVVAAYNALGFAAAAIGNHEFDFGPAGPERVAEDAGDDPRGALKQRAAQAKFPFLAANLVEQKTGKPVAWENVQPTALINAAGLKLGLIGLITRDAPTATIPANFAGLQVLPLAEVTKREAAKLRRESRVDLIVVVAHAGGECRNFGSPSDTSSCDSTSEIVAMLSQLPEGTVDAVIAGHTHHAMAHRIRGTAVIETHSYGRGFGRVDITYDRRAGRVARVKIYKPRFYCRSHASPDATCLPRPYEGQHVQPAANVSKALRPFLQQVERLETKPIGLHLSQTFPLAADKESAIGNWTVDTLHQAAPSADAALINGGGLRAALPKGEATYGDLFRFFPFDDPAVIAHVTAKQLAQAIAHSLQSERGIVSISGLRAVASCQNGTLHVKLRSASGKPLKPQTPLKLLTSDFVATGGDGLFTADEVDARRFAGSPTVRALLVSQLRARPQKHVSAAHHVDPQKPRLIFPSSKPVSCAK